MSAFGGKADIPLASASALFFGFFDFGFGGAGIVFRTGVSDYANSLDFDLDAGSGKIGDSDQCASGVVSIFEEVLAHFDKFVSVTGFLNKNCHRHDVV